MATTFEKLISLVAYDNALTERTDDFYLRAKTQPRTLGITEIARETVSYTHLTLPTNSLV